MFSIDGERTHGFKLVLTIVVGLALTIPLFSVWLLVYDRKTQSDEATALDHRRDGATRRRSTVRCWSSPIARR